jgi:hypothetical protein
VAQAEITTPTTRHSLRDDGLLLSEALPGAGQTLADAQESVAAYGALNGGRRRPLLVDLRAAGKPMDRAAREYYAGPELALVVSAAALLITSPVGRVIGTFFLRLSRTATPIRMFTDEAEALTWLHSYQDRPPAADAPAAGPDR